MSRPSTLPQLGAWLPVVLLVVVAYVVPRLLNSDYLFEAILLPFLALSLAGVGLNVLTGYTGQVSLGSAAFMAIGAYAAFNINLRVAGVPLPVTILAAGVIAALVGVAFGLPSLRLRGFYLAVSTLAAQFFVQWALTKFPWFSNDSNSGVIDAPNLQVAGISFVSPQGRYDFSLTVVVLLTTLSWRLVSVKTGRDFMAVRDHETAARIVGVPVLRAKLVAFAFSSFIIGVAGVLWAFNYLRMVEPGGFNLDRSFQILFIVIIGGLSTIRGAFLGSAIIVVLPLLLARASSALVGGGVDSGSLDMIQRILLGALIIGFLIAEPDGLAALSQRVSNGLAGRVRPQASPATR
jgi:branched-chain amino acid transport system permease protein